MISVATEVSKANCSEGLKEFGGSLRKIIQRRIAETHSESCETSKMDFFANIVNGAVNFFHRKLHLRRMAGSGIRFWVDQSPHLSAKRMTYCSEKISTAVTQHDIYPFLVLNGCCSNAIVLLDS